jgi:hypothetical protein
MLVCLRIIMRVRFLFSQGTTPLMLLETEKSADCVVYQYLANNCYSSSALVTS